MNDLSSLRCIVLGAGGFVGTNLCRSLVGKVDTLRAFGRRQSFPEALSHKDIDWIPGDFSDSSALASAVSGCDTVYHLITSTTPASSNVDKLYDLQANVASTLHLLDICKDQNVRRVIFVSSGGTVYGIPNQIPTPENSPLNPICAYGISKLAIEKYLALYEHLYGLEYRILRVSNPFGPFQTAIRSQGVISAFIHKVLNNRPIEVWGDGSIVRDYIYIDDVVDALKSASLHNGSERIFNIGSGSGKSLTEIIDAISHLRSIDTPTRYLDSRVSDVPTSILDISLAKEALSWQPKSNFLDGLNKTVAWQEHDFNV